MNYLYVKLRFTLNLIECRLNFICIDHYILILLMKSRSSSSQSINSYMYHSEWRRKLKGDHTVYEATVGLTSKSRRMTLAGSAKCYIDSRRVLQERDCSVWATSALCSMKFTDSACSAFNLRHRCSCDTTLC